jgi:N-acylglucosamine-6-phosphate 2-epimerase
LLEALRRDLPPGVALICEGGVASADQARQALERGADAVVVGTAITGIDLQVAAYSRALA